MIHYAGAVTYNINGFIEKNNDLLFRDLRDVMSKSSNSILQSVFLSKEQTSKKRPDTAITQFKNSLNNLMDILMNKEPSYIRCIKPNDTKSPGKRMSRFIENCILLFVNTTVHMLYTIIIEIGRYRI